MAAAGGRVVLYVLAGFRHAQRTALSVRAALLLPASPRSREVHSRGTSGAGRVPDCRKRVLTPESRPGSESNESNGSCRICPLPPPLPQRAFSAPLAGSSTMGVKVRVRPMTKDQTIKDQSGVVDCAIEPSDTIAEAKVREEGTRPNTRRHCSQVVAMGVHIAAPRATAHSTQAQVAPIPAVGHQRASQSARLGETRGLRPNCAPGALSRAIAPPDRSPSPRFTL